MNLLIHNRSTATPVAPAGPVELTIYPDGLVVLPGTGVRQLQAAGADVSQLSLPEDTDSQRWFCLFGPLEGSEPFPLKAHKGGPALYFRSKPTAGRLLERLPALGEDERSRRVGVSLAGVPHALGTLYPLCLPGWEQAPTAPEADPQPATAPLSYQPPLLADEEPDEAPEAAPAAPRSASRATIGPTHPGATVATSRPWTPAEDSAVRIGVKNGLKPDELAVKLGRSVGSVKQYITKKGYGALVFGGGPTTEAMPTPEPVAPAVPSPLLSEADKTKLRNLVLGIGSLKLEKLPEEDRMRALGLLQRHADSLDQVTGAAGLLIRLQATL